MSNPRGRDGMGFFVFQAANFPSALRTPTHRYLCYYGFLASGEHYLDISTPLMADRLIIKTSDPQLGDQI